MSEPLEGDTPLSELCAICHINTPKYRCPRCQTRTCSLPCTRRHKTWSQCSGVRDPGAYLRRPELATESAFDHDFNFISGVERSVERAGRDAENRGIRIYDGDGGRKRRRKGDLPPGDDGPGPELAKGEAGFLRRADERGVKVIKAPKGMSREKMNSSRWFPKRKCLNWSIEWIPPDGKKTIRNSLEESTVGDAYDRAYPVPKEESMGFVRVQVQDHLQGLDSNSNSAQIEAEDVPAPSPPPPPPLQPPQPNSEPTEIPPHRNTYFYLLRPRTATKHPVLIPLAPNITLSAALAGRTVLEFPTIYVLGDSPRTLLTEKEKKTDRFLLEEEYLRTKPEQADVDGDGDGDMRMENTVPDTLDTGQVDEQRVLEVLKKDLFGAGSTQSA